jgi:DNA-binding CsgD family transcriptional regulator
MNTNAVLSKRENQMITGLVMGLCKKEIASQLFISVRTAESTIRNAMTKAEVRKSTDLVTFWFVQHFSIPLDQLPKSITAAVFLLLFCSYEFNTQSDTIRASRSRSRRGERSEETKSEIKEFGYAKTLVSKTNPILF